MSVMGAGLMAWALMGLDARSRYRVEAIVMNQSDEPAPLHGRRIPTAARSSRRLTLALSGRDRRHDDGAAGLRFVLAPVFRKSATRLASRGQAGHVQDRRRRYWCASKIPSAEAWAGVTATTAAWLRRVGESEFIAFSINCRHLGCPVRWVDTAGLFMCPCHGGVYYSDGTVAGGPPPEPLDRYPVRVQEAKWRSTPRPCRSRQRRLHTKA